MKKVSSTIVLHGKKQKLHYVDNEQFYQAILAYREKVKQAVKEGKPEPRLSDYIGLCIYNIANRLSYSPKFINYSFRDEMIAEAIKNSIEYFNSYNPERLDANGKYNPFSYFTQICFHAFVHCINKEEKHRYTRCKNFESTLIQNGNHTLLVDEENNLLPSSTYDNITSFIERFENKEREKKEKRKRMKELKDEKRSDIAASDQGASGQPDSQEGAREYSGELQKSID